MIWPQIRTEKVTEEVGETAIGKETVHSFQSFLMNQDAAFDMAANQNQKGNRRGGGNGDRKRDG